MKLKTLVCLSALTILAASVSLSITPVFAKPNEVLIIVKNQSTGNPVGSNVLIAVWPELDSSHIDYYWTDLNSRVTITNDGSWTTGSSLVIAESNYGVLAVVGGVSIRHNGGARVTVYVDPLV